MSLRMVPSPPSVITKSDSLRISVSFFALIGSVKTLPKSKVLVTRFPYESRFGGEEVHTLRLMEELDKRGIEAFFLGSCPILLREFKERGFWVKRAWLAKPRSE